MKASLLRSCQCTQAQLESDTFQDWAVQLREQRMHLHRKTWEYCYIAQALHERGMLRAGRRGLGFAVGQEPLPSLFASYGCEIVATDLAAEEAVEGDWVATDQHATSVEVLSKRGICPDELFRDRVSLRYVDMRNIPGELRDFDFVWSACALEHLGSLKLGEQFVYESLRCVKPGGVAVHTTEYNCSSNLFTKKEGIFVIYRKRDIKRIGSQLKKQGFEVDLDFSRGNLPADRFVEKPPYDHKVHLKLELDGFVATSYGLIIQKPTDR
jgi:2-polyprenyl-3-methyl-5-hydroxy-6-metoxy-1,4-benzoquinol methylase